MALPQLLVEVLQDRRDQVGVNAHPAPGVGQSKAPHVVDHAAVDLDPLAAAEDDVIEGQHAADLLKPEELDVPIFRFGVVHQVLPIRVLEPVFALVGSLQQICRKPGDVDLGDVPRAYDLDRRQVRDIERKSERLLGTRVFCCRDEVRPPTYDRPCRLTL